MYLHFPISYKIYKNNELSEVVSGSAVTNTFIPPMKFSGSTDLKLLAIGLSTPGEIKEISLKEQELARPDVIPAKKGFSVLAGGLWQNRRNVRGREKALAA